MLVSLGTGLYATCVRAVSRAIVSAMAKGPSYSDDADIIQLFRVAAWFGVPCFVMLTAAWGFMLNKGWIPPLVFVLLVIVNIPVTVAGILAGRAGVSGSAKRSSARES